MKEVKCVMFNIVILDSIKHHCLYYVNYRSHLCSNKDEAMGNHKSSGKKVTLRISVCLNTILSTCTGVEVNFHTFPSQQ
jgi:hypothetical protein